MFNLLQRKNSILSTTTHSLLYLINCQTISLFPTENSTTSLFQEKICVPNSSPESFLVEFCGVCIVPFDLVYNKLGMKKCWSRVWIALATSLGESLIVLKRKKKQAGLCLMTCIAQWHIGTNLGHVPLSPLVIKLNLFKWHFYCWEKWSPNCALPMSV